MYFQKYFANRSINRVRVVLDIQLSPLTRVCLSRCNTTAHVANSTYSIKCKDFKKTKRLVFSLNFENKFYCFF